MEGRCVFTESWVGLGVDTGGVLGIHGNLFGGARVDTGGVLGIHGNVFGGARGGQWRGLGYSW